MGPPAYSELGREARDIFIKDFHVGLIKINCKSKTPIGAELSASGQSHVESGKLEGSLEARYQLKDIGATLMEKWISPTIVSTDITFHNLPIKGLKVGIGNTLSFTAGAKNLLIKSGFTHERMNISFDMDLSQSGSLLSTSGVTSYKNMLVGSHILLKGFELKKTGIAFGYKGSDTILHLQANNNMEIGGSLFHRVNSRMHCGGQATCTLGSTGSKYGIGFVYKLSSSTQFRGMINSVYQIGLGLSHALKPGVTVNFSAQSDDKSWKPKMGLGFDIEA